MLVEKTIHGGLRVLGDIIGVNGNLTGTLTVGSTAWITGKITGLAGIDISGGESSFSVDGGGAAVNSVVLCTL